MPDERARGRPYRRRHDDPPRHAAPRRVGGARRRAPGRRPGRQARPVRRRTRTSDHSRLGNPRRRAGGVRPEGRDGALGRRMAGGRLRVGAGPGADRTKLCRAIELGAAGRRPLPVHDDVRARVPAGAVPRGAPARRGRARGVRAGTAPRREHLRGRAHRRRDGRSEGRPDGDGRRCRRAQTGARACRRAVGLRLAHRLAGHVERLQHGEQGGDDEVRAALVAGDDGDHRARLRLARRRGAAAAADDPRPGRVRRAAGAADGCVRHLDLGDELRADVLARARDRLRAVHRAPLPRLTARPAPCPGGRRRDDGHRGEGRPVLRDDRPGLAVGGVARAESGVPVDRARDHAQRRRRARCDADAAARRAREARPEGRRAAAGPGAVADARLAARRALGRAALAPSAPVRACRGARSRPARVADPGTEDRHAVDQGRPAQRRLTDRLRAAAAGVRRRRTGALQIAAPQRQAAAVVAAAQRDPGIARVLPPEPGAGGVALVQAIPVADASHPATGQTIERLRAALPPGALVGGYAAENHDLARRCGRRPRS